MNPSDSSCRHSQRVSMILEASAIVPAESAAFIRDRYQNRRLLETAIDFCNYDLVEAPSASFHDLRKVGFFPWVESSDEFDSALTLALQGHYKATVDHIRRGLELILIGIYFTATKVDEQYARAWLKSERNTPFFSKVSSQLAKLERFSAIDTDCQWLRQLESFYYKLCDIIHVKGTGASYQNIQPCRLRINGIKMLSLHEKSLETVLDLLIHGARHCATALSLSNPIILVGLPLEEKFGMNPPASGFFNQAQSERLWALLSPGTEAFLLA